MKKIIFALFMTIFCLPSLLMATTLTKDDIIELALKNNKTLEIAKLNLTSSIRTTEENTLLPSISLAAGISTSGSAENKSFTFVSPSVNASVNFSISSTDKYSRESNTITKQNAELTFESSTNSVKSSAITAYWNTILSYYALEQANMNFENSQSTYENRKEAYEGGLITELTLLEAELDVANSMITKETCENTYFQALESLSFLIGTDDFEIDYTVPEITGLKDIETIIAKKKESLAYRTSELSVQNAMLNEMILKNTLISPTYSFSASVSLSPNYTLSYTNNTWNSKWNYISDKTTISASVSLPLDHLFSSSSASIKLDNAATSTQSARLSLKNTEENIEQSIKNQYNTIISYIRAIDNTEKYINLLEKQLETTQEAYEAGYKSFSDVLATKNSLFAKQISLLQTKLNCLSAVEALSQTINADTSAILL